MSKYTRYAQHGRLACALLAACLGLAVAPRQAAAAACRQLHTSAHALKFAGPELVPVFQETLGAQSLTLALDLGRLEPRFTFRGGRTLKLSMTKSFFAAGDQAPDKATLSLGLLGRVKAGVDPLSDDSTPWDIVAGADGMLKNDLELALHDGYFKVLTVSACPTEPLSYWDPQAVQVPYTRLEGERLPHFTVTVDGVGLDAVLSIIQARSTITPAAAARVGLKADGDPAAPAQAGFGVLRIGKVQSRNGYLDIAEHAPQAELVLGNEFLRAYRVLLSAHQRKLYLSYQSGPSFPKAGAISYWLEHEAEAGSGAAQYALWRRKQAGAAGGGTAGPGAIPAAEWLARAAGSREPAAYLAQARMHRSAGKQQEGVALLRQALKAVPGDALLALELYLATRQAGNAAAAVEQLRTARKDIRDTVWPHPVGAFFLGEIELDDLLRMAGRLPEVARERSCAARRNAAEFYTLEGQPAEAARQLEAHRAHCAGAAVPGPHAAQAAQ